MARVIIRIPNKIIEQIRPALLRCGNRECGGILMGEHIGQNEFRVANFTVQSNGGTISRFVRTVTGLITKLAEFFEKTEHRYKKYNYLGEWHSHPLFALKPSQEDFQTMRNIIDDPNVGANFVVLILVKINSDRVDWKAWSLLPGGMFETAQIIIDRKIHDILQT